MEVYIREYVKACDICQRNKTPRRKPAGLLEPIIIERPFKMVGIDIVGPLTPSFGDRYIIVATDYFTKWAQKKATPTFDAVETARFFLEQIYCRHGAPEILLSDCGRKFLSALVNEIVTSLGTKRYQTSSYHPQTNGLTELVNGILTQALKLYVDTNRQNWSKLLSLVTFAYNNSKQGTTKYSPFALLYNRNPVFPIDIMLHTTPEPFQSEDDYFQHIQNHWETTQQNVLASIRKVAEANKEQCDKKHTNL
jgi:hypothetical protein